MNNDGKPTEFKTDFNLTCHAMYNIGVSVSNRRWYDAAHLWLKSALHYCQNETSSILDNIKQAYKCNIKLHDQLLETRSSINGGTIQDINGRSFALPISAKVRRQKKYMTNMQPDQMV